MLKRRNAIEPVIGHLKPDGRLTRNLLEGTTGDAINAIFYGAGYNLRKMLYQLRLYRAKFRRYGALLAKLCANAKLAHGGYPPTRRQPIELPQR